MVKKFAPSYCNIFMALWREQILTLIKKLDMKFWTKKLVLQCRVPVVISLIAWLTRWVVEHAAYFFFFFFLARRGRQSACTVFTDFVDISEYSRWLSPMLPQHISPYHLDADLSGTIYVYLRSTHCFTQCTRTTELNI